MTEEIDQYKLWLETYLLELDKNLDTDVYIEYIYEILSNFCQNSNNKDEVIENLHSILESLLPEIKINKSNEIFDKYLNEIINKKLLLNANEIEKVDFLSEIINNDKNAIDKNKRETRLDPRYALDYKSGEICESDDNYCGTEEQLDIEFAPKRIQNCNKIDDVLSVFDSENQKVSNINKDKLAAINVTKNLILLKQNYDSDDDDSDDPDYDPILDESGKSNREAVDRSAQELRQKMKEKHQQKKEKDKVDRAKQKEQIKSRKENEKKRTQKSEKRR